MHSFAGDISDMRFIDAVESWTLPLMVLNTKLEFSFANQAYLDSTRKTWPELEGRHVFDVFPEHPDRVQQVLHQFQGALNGSVTRLDTQPFHIMGPDGQEHLHYWQATQEPIKDASGRVTHIVQYAEDVTSRVQAETQRDLIAQELNHRVKNVLSVIQSIARLSSRGQTSVEDFTDEFVSRVGAMSRAHERLYKNDFLGMSLKDLLNDELSAMSVQGEDKFSLDGPSVELSAETAKDLSMVVHELSTNAAKYGCFSVETGSLDIIWTTTATETEIVWTETGVGEVGPMKATGFGSKLLRVVRGIDCVRRPHSDGIEVRITLNHSA